MSDADEHNPRPSAISALITNSNPDRLVCQCGASAHAQVPPVHASSFSCLSDDTIAFTAVLPMLYSHCASENSGSSALLRNHEFTAVTTKVILENSVILYAT
jgi:hypothetical protein